MSAPWRRNSVGATSPRRPAPSRAAGLKEAGDTALARSQHFLKNRFYVGDVAYRGEIHAGEHEPIVDRATFGGKPEAACGRLRRITRLCGPTPSPPKPRNGNEAGRAGSSHKAKRPRRAEPHYRSAATEKPVLSGSSYCWFLADRIIE